MIAESILGELDHEMSVTRKLLERFPEADASWKPHSKSYSLGDLASHIAHLPSWAPITLKGTEYDVGAGYRNPGYESKALLLKTFDENVREARETIASTSDAEMMVNWSLKNGATTVFTMPRIAVLRSFVMNHSIHHRGQFSVYLRLRDVPVPAMYGPSADES